MSIVLLKALFHKYFVAMK